MLSGVSITCFATGYAVTLALELTRLLFRSAIRGAVMLGWLVVSAGIALFYRPAREGHKVAYLTEVSFLFLLIALGAGLFLKAQHGGGGSQGARVQRSGAGAEGLRYRVSGSRLRHRVASLPDPVSTAHRARSAQGGLS